MKSYYIGIDNGVSGSIAVLSTVGRVIFFGKTPITNCLNYTKSKAFINRINGIELKNILLKSLGNDEKLSGKSICYIERPMVNPGRFKATVSALRALEATLIILEDLSIPYQYIDSKEWQKALLPSGLHKGELKAAAIEVAKRIFPKIKTKDADGILIAEHARRTYR